MKTIPNSLFLLAVVLAGLNLGCVQKKTPTEDNTHLMHGSGRVQTTPMSDSAMPGR